MLRSWLPRRAARGGGANRPAGFRRAASTRSHFRVCTSWSSTTERSLQLNHRRRSGGSTPGRRRSYSLWQPFCSILQPRESWTGFYPWLTRCSDRRSGFEEQTPIPFSYRSASMNCASAFPPSAALNAEAAPEHQKRRDLPWRLQRAQRSDSLAEALGVVVEVAAGSADGGAHCVLR
jgi:hypothetical protein